MCTSVDLPIHVSSRFRITLERTILTIEAEAGQDERVISTLEDPDHRRRQRMLVAAQLEKAYALRRLLERTVIRNSNREAEAALRRPPVAGN